MRGTCNCFPSFPGGAACLNPGNAIGIVLDSSTYVFQDVDFLFAAEQFGGVNDLEAPMDIGVVLT